MPQHDVAALADLPDAHPVPIEVDGTKILLTRFGDAVFAVDATCPHAGASLAEGIQDGNHIICPWHKATFCLRTGALLEPPAVDDLPCYKVDILGDRVQLTMPAEPAAKADSPADTRVFAIVGGGAAGAVAAQTLRQAGYAGRVVMFDRENRVPYDRTLLSKYHLSGQPGAEKTPLQSQSFYKENNIERRTAEVTAVDATQKHIVCADGTTLTYDKALLATGAAPALPKLPGAHLKNVFLLRSRADADAILEQAERSERAVVLGASFIGMEVAASLRERGLEVTVVGMETAPFEKQLGARIGNCFVGLHQKQGVNVRLGKEIQSLQGDGTVRSVTLRGGESLAADLVVIGFGVKPVSNYLRNHPLNEDGSITVDDTLQAADDLFAAGDIARFPYGGKPIRVEHWRVAQQHGRVAALNMLGQTTRYSSVPVFWTIQYMKRLDYIGHATEWDDIIVHGDLEKPQFLAYYVAGGQVIAAAGLDRDDDTAALIALMQRRQDWTPDELGASPSNVLAGRTAGDGTRSS